MATYAYRFDYNPNGEYQSKAIEGDLKQVPPAIFSSMGRFRDEIMAEADKRKKPISVEVRIESALIE